MALNVLTRSDTPVEIILSCDPAVMLANGEDALKQYLEHGHGDTLSIPTDATRFGVRALSQVEMDEAREEASREHPSIELRAMHAYQHAGDEALTDNDFTAMREFVAFRTLRDIALVKRGLVSIDGDKLPADGYRIFAPESDEGIYPMVKRGEMLAELASHITRISDLGPLGKSRYSLRFG